MDLQKGRRAVVQPVVPMRSRWALDLLRWRLVIALEAAFAVIVAVVEHNQMRRGRSSTKIATAVDHQRRNIAVVGSVHDRRRLAGRARHVAARSTWMGATGAAVESTTRKDASIGVVADRARRRHVQASTVAIVVVVAVGGDHRCHRRASPSRVERS